MFEKSLEIIKNSFIDYKGTGGYAVLYCIALVYLLLKEEDKAKKAFTIYFPILVLLVVMNPLFNKMVGGILKEGAYWRVFWLIPMGITIAYAGTKFVDSLEEKSKKIIVSLCFIGIIILGGKYMYEPGNFYEYGNSYKLPDEMVYVTQILGADEAEYKKALVSYYLAPYIRQIDGTIELAYGRSSTPYTEKSLATVVGLGIVDQIAEKAKQTNSNYIILHKETPVLGDFEEHGYSLLRETDDYRIYKLMDENKTK